MIIINPTRGYILSEVLSEEKLLPSGLWLATTTKKGVPPKRVKVIALGLPTYATKPLKRVVKGKPQVVWVKLSKEKPWHFKTGDILYIKPHAGIPIWIDQKNHLFLKRGDIIGVDGE